MKFILFNIKQERIKKLKSISIWQVFPFLQSILNSIIILNKGRNRLMFYTNFFESFFGKAPEISKLDGEIGAFSFRAVFLILLILCSCSSNEKSIKQFNSKSNGFLKLQTPPKDSSEPSAYSNKTPNVRFYKDKNHVYDDFMRPKEGVDPASFEVLSYELVRDKNHVYRIEYPKEFKKLKQIDVPSFTFIGGNDLGGGISS